MLPRSQIPNGKKSHLICATRKHRNNNVSLNSTISFFFSCILLSFDIFFSLSLFKRDCLPLKLKFLLESHKEIESFFLPLLLFCTACLLIALYYCICTLLYHSMLHRLVWFCCCRVSHCKIDSGS